jgi:hypothetical protein
MERAVAQRAFFVKVNGSCFSRMVRGPLPFHGAVLALGENPDVKHVLALILCVNPLLFST